MDWRPIGPANMGGRVTDIAGIPGDPATYYFGGADGGVFKTTNAGFTFETLFTDQKAYGVGAIESHHLIKKLFGWDREKEIIAIVLATAMVYIARLMAEKLGHTLVLKKRIASNVLL